MIYATDLDRTLIFSQVFLKEYKEFDAKDLLVVDSSNIDSYISKEVLAELTNILNTYKDLRFIPVTTRSINLYNRINIPGINPKYAITSNGGTILYQGKELKEWKNQLDKVIDISKLKEIGKIISEYFPIKSEPKLIDNRYLYLKIDNVGNYISQFNELIANYPDFYMHYFKSKVYVIPNIVSKEIALDWLIKHLDEECLIVSGDSNADIPMMHLGYTATIPSHSEIFKNEQLMELLNFNYYVTSGGIKSPLQTLCVLKNLILRRERNASK